MNSQILGRQRNLNRDREGNAHDAFRPICHTVKRE